MRSLALAACFSTVVACSGGDGNQTPDTQLDTQPAALTNIARATFSFTALGNSTGFLCAIDTPDPSPCIPPLIVDMADGAHTFSVAAQFNANVDETPATYSWTVDTVGPDTTIIAGPPAVDNDPSPDFTFSGSDPGPVTFECSLDTAPATPCTSPLTLNVVDGNHSFTVAAVDAAGNRDATPAVLDWSVSTLTPDTTITSGPTAGSTTNANVAFGFSSPDSAATFECAMDAAGFTACSTGIAFNGLTDGGHTFQVRAKAVAGVDPSPAMRAWTVDAVAPTVTITGTPSNPSNDTTPQFAFSSVDTTATFECQVDGVQAFTACTSPFDSPAIVDGTHTFRVRATDPVGNLGAESTFAWLVDTVAPTVVINTQPAALSNDATPTVTFTTGGAPSTTQCQVDTGALVNCAATFTPTVADGTHTITVVVTDAATNTASATTNSFIVDTIAPTVVINSEPLALSNDNTPTVTFTTGGSPTSTQCRVDAGAFVSCAGTFTPTVADGAHTLTIRVTDGANNTSSATTSSFTVDTVAPTVVINSQPAALSNDNTPTVTFTTGGSPTSTQCQIDAGAFANCSSPFSPAVADGAHTITIKVADAATNTASATTNSFTVDTVPPTVVINTQPLALSNDNTPTVTFTTGGAPTSIQCQIDAGAFANCSSPFTPTVADGTHTITIRVTDTATNSATATTASFIVDTAPPTVVINSQPAAVSNDNTPTVTFTTGGSPTSIQCQIDTGVFADCTSPFTPTVGDGAHTITIRVTDAATNSASATTNSFTVDTLPPTVVINTEPAPVSNDNTPTVTFTVGGSPTSTQCQVDTGAFVNCASPFTATVGDGTHTITIKVTDAATNTFSISTSSFVVDTSPPTVVINSQPAALSNDNTPTVTFTTGGSPTSTQCQLDTGAFANCSSPFTITVLDGTHTITVKVTDAATNTASATTNSFTVDTTAPTVVINTQPAALSNDLTPTVTFTTGGSPITTQCQVDTGSLVNCAGGTFTPTVTEGTHTITIIVTDGATNSASATTNSFTVDVTPPTVTINSEPLAISNDVTPTVTFTTGGAPISTQCRVDAGGLSNCVGGTFTPTVAQGTHTITIIVTDGANNSASATTASFIVDTTAPVVTFDDTPPAQWPVNYFDMRFHATDANVVVAIECSLNGQAFFGCATGQTITTSYNTASTFAVRARDNAGNTSAAIQTSWTSTDGLVLHYPWEQGATNNTSLLAQNLAYSPNGTIAAAPAIGGWAGTALGSVVPGHNYKNTDRILSSSANGNYAASFWVRLTDSANGTVFSTLASGNANGIRVSQSSSTLTVTVGDGSLHTAQVGIGINQWVHIALRATGPGKPLEIWVNGAIRTVVPANTTGFDAGQARDMTVGPWNGMDVDDLRFFNGALADTEMCTLLTRGSIRNSVCTPMSPGIEFDFEHGVVLDTGVWHLGPLNPQSQTFNKGKTGDFMTLSSPFTWGSVGGFQAQAATAHGHSLSFWFTANNTFGRLLDFTGQCVVGGPPDRCGISVTFVDNQNVQVFVGTFGHPQFKTVSVLPGKSNSIVITERRTVDTTISVSIYVNGALATVIGVPNGDVYNGTSDNVFFVANPGTPVDEYEFWTEDLEANPEVLCENGFDGEFDPLTGNCSLTSN